MLLARGMGNAHVRRVNTAISQRKATRRDPSRPVAEYLSAFVKLISIQYQIEIDFHPTTVVRDYPHRRQRHQMTPFFIDGCKLE
jgi:hypothetical protein